MHIGDGRLIFTATDLAGFSKCDHLLRLDHDYALGKAAPYASPFRSPFAELLSRRGGEHEADYVQRIQGDGDAYREIEIAERSRDGYGAAATATIEAMREGVLRIYQAVLFDGEWLGIADFLIRVERPSVLGSWSYEVLDVKLARTVRPHFLLQLCSYAEQLNRIQQLEPEWMHISLGTGESFQFRWNDFKAYYRRLKHRFVELLNNNRATYPYPNEFCQICHWSLNCWRNWEHDDHLSLVADIRRQHVQRLTAGGVTTLTKLGEADPEKPVSPFRKETFRKLHDQARLQLGQRRSGERRHEYLPLKDERGFRRLPAPTPGDLFFDVEADPFAGGDGLTYLFGVGWQDERFGYEARWSHDSAAEKIAFEEVIDLLTARRARFPEMHVYHYGAADVSVLKRLMGQYATREEELDELLRGRVFVDLYSILRHAIRISLSSYSLKKVEEFYFSRTQQAVSDAGGALLAYEEWLESGNEKLLHAIEAYNREDCLSAAQLRDWFVKLRREAEQHFRVTMDWWRPPEPPTPSEESVAARKEEDELSDALLARAPEGEEGGSPEERAHWLLGHLVRYHRLEDKPAWWWHHQRREMSDEDRFEDHESIANLAPHPKIGPVHEKKSTVFAFTFPPQQHKFESGDSPIDPVTDKSAGEIVSIDDRTCVLRLKRGPSLVDVPLPTALIPGKPINAMVIRQALRRVARNVLASGFSTLSYRAITDLLVTRSPRIRGVAAGTALHGLHTKLDDLEELVLSLDDSFLFIQGPPGAGKTWTGARLVVHLLKQKKRVGVAASTHKSIHNLLHEIEAVAIPNGLPMRGLKKRGDEDDTEFESKFGVRSPIGNSSKVADFTDPTLTLIAGTAWLFSNAQLDQKLDYLFVDEAGQVSLANAVAMATSARNVVFLGDPLQLAQVSQGVHPGRSGNSVLEHILGSDATIPPSRGVFLERTWRMHPDVCRFVSEIVYESRLEAAPECGRQRVESGGLSGTGIRFLGVSHEGNSRFSDEEAARIRDEISVLLRGGSFTDSKGVTRPLSPSDILVVTPYNLQVRCIGATLRSAGLAAVEVGTVDKFQGREAAVVFYSMATSSGEDLPREIEFLFSRNRLNVAVSRARCLSVVVASPRLLDTPCRTPEQMRLVNGLCRFVELAASA